MPKSATYAAREFLSTDASEPALVLADVITDGSDPKFLHLESTFRLGDGETWTNVDVSVFGELKTHEDREEAAQAIKTNLAIVRNLMSNVEAWGHAYTEAAIEALSEIRSADPVIDITTN